MPTRGKAWADLCEYLRIEMIKQGMHPDKYDPDFIVGTIQQYLERNDLALTGSGVKRFRRRR